LAELPRDHRHRHRETIEEVGLRHPQEYLGFLGTLFLFVATASVCIHRRCASAQLPDPGMVAETFSLLAHSSRNRRAG
jgi:hypothetical protein